MNAFQDGSWHFRAAVEPTANKYEVHYYDARYERNGVMPFVDRAAAEQFADKHGGEVKEIAPRPFRLERAR